MRSPGPTFPSASNTAGTNGRSSLTGFVRATTSTTPIPEARRFCRNGPRATATSLHGAVGATAPSPCQAANLFETQSISHAAEVSPCYSFNTSPYDCIGNASNQRTCDKELTCASKVSTEPSTDKYPHEVILSQCEKVEERP